MTNELDTARVYAALDQVMDPELHHSLVALGLIRDVDIVDGVVRVELQLTTPHCPFADRIVQSVRDAVGTLEGVERVDVERPCLGDA